MQSEVTARGPLVTPGQDGDRVHSEWDPEANI